MPSTILVMNLRPAMVFVMACVLLGATTVPVQRTLGAQPATSALAEKAAPRVLAALADGRTPDVLIHFAQYPDLAAARTLPAKQQKTAFVVDALRANAAQSQAAVRELLVANNVQHESLWLINAIAMKGVDGALLTSLAGRGEVARIEMDAAAMVPPDHGAGPQAATPQRAAQAPQANEWGVAKVKAPEAWARGHTGQGIVIANLDTGVRWDHEALKPSYRGWVTGTSTVDHNYSWFDPYSKTIATASDDQGHGTHTAGTHSGANGIGVAPGSQWIACRNMNSGFGAVSSYAACFQFALAPTDVNGANPRPDLAADITNNSWGCDYTYLGGEPGCDVPTALITVTQALRDAGVMIVASNGNDGSGCGSTLFAPGTLDQAFTVGALDSANNIAGFSSRGPSSLNGGTRPHISAPGVSVRSSTPGGTASYGNASGTSMAGPHVAGVVALLWSAAPWLRGMIDETEDMLERSATPLTTAQTCGGIQAGVVPNNTYGHGLINAEAAISMALTTTLLSVAPITPQYASPSLPFTLEVTATNAFSTAVLNDVLITATLSSPAVFLSDAGVALGQHRAFTITALAANVPVTSALKVSSTVNGLYTVTVDALAFVNGAAVPVATKGGVFRVGTPPTYYLPFVVR